MRPLTVIPFVALVAGLAVAGPAAARPACGDAVIADWSDGRIDAVYAPGCYAKALDALPEDVRAYSTAEDDIATALRARIRADAQRGRAAQRAVPARPADRSRRLSVREPERAGTDETAAVAAQVAEATPVPVPLLVAAVIALLLCVAGSARLIGRRHAPRRPLGQC